MVLNSLCTAMYLILWAASGLYCTRLMWRHSTTPRIDLVHIAVLALLLFFLPLNILGYFELITGYAALKPPFLLAVETLLILAAYLFRQKLFRFGDEDHTNAPSPETNTLPIKTMALTGLAFVVIAASLMLGFPRGFEVTAYHLPIGLNFFQTGSIMLWDRAFMHTYPADGSFYYGLLLQIVPERLVSAANLPFLALTGFVVYSLSRTLNSTKEGAALSTLGLFTVPIVIFSTLELGTDIAGIALIGLAMLLLISASAANLLRAALLAGAMAGLAYSFKSLHLIAATYLGLLTLIYGYKTGNRPVRNAITAGALFSLGFLALAGVWLARNWIVLGNPIYPVNFAFLTDLFGFTAATDVDFQNRTGTQLEWVNSSWGWLLYPWLEGHSIDQNYKHSSGFGAFFAVFIMVALVVTPFRFFRQRLTDDNVGKSLALWVGAIFIILSWWLLGDRQPRYLMASIVFALPLVALMIDQAAMPWRRHMIKLAQITIIVMMAIITSKEVLYALSHFAISRQFTRDTYYEYPAAIDHLPAHSVILNLGPRPVNYSLYGSKLQNRVLPPSSVTQGGGFGGIPSPTPQRIKALGITHIYSDGPLEISLESDFYLEEIERYDRNPRTGIRLLMPRILYRVSNRERTDDPNRP